MVNAADVALSSLRTAGELSRRRSGLGASLGAFERRGIANVANAVVVDGTTIQQAIDAARSQVLSELPAANDDSIRTPICRPVYVPAGEYVIFEPLLLLPGVSLVCFPAARIRAGVVMDVLLDTPGDALLQRGVIEGGLWNCDGKAATAICLRVGVAMWLRNLRINDPTGRGIIIGDPAATSTVTSYEVMIDGIHLFRRRGTLPEAGFAGLWMQDVTDSHVANVVPRGFDIGIRNDGGNNTLFRCHPWNPSGTMGPAICFDDDGSNSRWIDCYADNPSGIGFRFRGSSSYEMTNCTMQ